MGNPVIKQQLLEILKAIDAICLKEGLSYMMTFGTLLGAVREKGFIEWDDDADLMMLRKDYNAFEARCQGHLAELGLFLDRSERVPNVALVEDPSIMVDLCILDALPKKPLHRKWQNFELKLLQGMMKKDVDYAQYDSVGKLLVFGTSTLGKFMTDAAKLKTYMRISQRANVGGADELFMSNGLYRFIGIPFKKELVAETVRLPFEDLELLAPAGWDQVLRLFFGNDYMTPKRENYYAEI
ncbi:LicD family protein [Trichococcus flocculiformis]|uniref:LicD family protein n=1 Tax=Trichococcus flocculiformis TaxID=82803 RepID=UPI003DA6C1A4